MPWTAADAKGHTKAADTPAKQKRWAEIANDADARCKEKGGTDDECEASAIRQANSVIAQEGFDEWFDGLDEDVQQLVEDHIHGLKSALIKERQARKDAERRGDIVSDLLLEADVFPPGYAHATANFAGSPRNKFGTHSSYGFKGDYAAAWRRHFAKISDTGPIQGTVRRTEMIAATMKPACSLPGTESIGARAGGDISGDFPKSPGDYGLSSWADPENDKDREGMKLSCKDLAVIKRAALAEIKYRAEKREKAGKESASDGDILGDVIPLVEKAMAADGTIPIKVIQPGWGQSGFYSPGLLERDGPKVFPAGTQMFWDHPTQSEERERPERSLRDLAGELTEDAHYEPAGVYGPGLYARAKIFGEFANSVDELAPHIGLSINAWGRAEEGEAGGKEGKVIQEISGARSVDFVTVPGAGGQILELFEAARRRSSNKGDDDMADEKLKEELKQEKAARQKLETETARLREVVLLGEAQAFVSGKLAEQDIPEMTKGRLIESLSKDPPVKDEKLDEDALDKKITEAVKEEMEYLSKVTGSGEIRGLGESEKEATKEEVEQLEESWIEHFVAKGADPEQAKVLAREAMSRR